MSISGCAAAADTALPESPARSTTTTTTSRASPSRPTTAARSSSRPPSTPTAATSTRRRSPYAFTGKERDPDTGLYDFGARVYDPKLGLFLSPDPALLADPELAIEDPQLLGIYGYARNNPTTHVDSDGRFPHILIGALVGAMIGGGAYLVKAAITKDFSVKGALAATAGGAVAGAVAAATCGASLLVQGAAAGVAGGIAQRGIETGSLSKTLSPKAIALDRGARCRGRGRWEGRGEGGVQGCAEARGCGRKRPSRAGRRLSAESPSPAGATFEW